MIAVKCSYLAFLSLLTHVAAQDDFFASRIAYTLSSKGPAVTIALEWEDPGRGSRQLFNVELCSPQKNCTRGKTFNGHRTMTFTDDGLNILTFFNTYYVKVQQNVFWTGRTDWSRRAIFTGPGELPPLRGVVATGGNENVTFTWQNPQDGVPKIDKWVEIDVCPKLSGPCLPTHRRSTSLGKYTMPRLAAGVEYTANLSVYTTFEKKPYRGQPVSVGFMTEPPEVKQFPPIKDLRVKAVGKGEYVVLEVGYGKPAAPRGAEFRGVRIVVSDRFKSILADEIVDEGRKAELGKYPYYAHLTVEVRAVYDDDTEEVESVAVSMPIATGTSALPPKPRNLAVTSISSSSALITWSHTVDKSVELSYRIVINDKTNLDIDNFNGNYTVINDNLEPDRVNNITFITRVVYESTSVRVASEQKQFRMLPRDALVAKLSVEDILGNLLYLNWNVKLPAGDRTCHLWVNQCDVTNSCTRTSISNMSDPMLLLDVEPFKRYSITMNTTCVFVPDIIVSGISEVMNVLAASRPPAVLGLEGDSPDENTLSLSWNAGPPYTKGYRVRYGVFSEDSWEEVEFPSPSCTISGLEASTEYDVSVVPFSVNGTRKLTGPPTIGTFQTLGHVPPVVTDLAVSQVDFTRTITVNWTAPPYDNGRLGFKVTTRCKKLREFTTQATSLEFKTEETLSDPSQKCAVSVRTFPLGPGHPTYSRAVHQSTNLKTLPPPLGADAVFVADGKYRLKVKPPQVDGVKKFVYQASRSMVFVKSYETDEFVVDEDRFDTTVSYAVRVCVNDLCSKPFSFSFVTNTGPPDRVRYVGLEIINATSINVIWVKPLNLNGPIDGYFVTITKSGDQNPIRTFEKAPTETSLVFKADREYTKYDVAVRAFNYDKFNRTVLKYGEDQIESIETHGTVPRPPLQVKTAPVQGRKTIQWNAGAATKFDIKCFKIAATTAQTQEQTVLLRTDPVLELSDPLLTPYTEYVFEISSCLDTACVKCGEPAAYKEMTEVGYPSPPNVQLVDLKSSQILLRWSKPTNPNGLIDGYELAFMKRTDGLSPSNWSSISVDDRSATIDNLEENTAYVFNVRAYNIDSGSEKLYSSVGAVEANTKVVKKGGSTAVVVTSVVFGVAGSAALAYVGFWKFGHLVRR